MRAIAEGFIGAATAPAKPRHVYPGDNSASAADHFQIATHG
jgi:hypothetical protein